MSFKSLKEKWDNQDPARRSKLTKLFGAVVLVGLLFIVGQMRATDKEQEKLDSNAGQYGPLQERVDKFNETVYRSTNKKIKDIEAKQTNLSRKNEALERKVGELITQNKKLRESGRQYTELVEENRKALEQTGATFNQSLDQLRQQLDKDAGVEDTTGVADKSTFPEPPKKTAKETGVSDYKVAGWDIPKTQPIQHIAVASKQEGTIGVKKTLASAPDNKAIDKKETAPERGIYLASGSMMEADLLTGYAAETMQGGKSDPIKVVLRVRDLAVLPNDVRLNVEGCFVTAEGQGRLSDERVHFRLLTLSCLSGNGTAVIDSQIQGQIIDNDGYVGLSGNVITKAGALIGRTFVAGVFEGFGEGVSAGSWEVNTSAIGQTSTLDTSDVAKAGFGKGLETASQRVAEYFLDLAEQVVPVIEGGAGRPVTLQIFKGVNLKIKNVCLDPKGCDDTDKEETPYASLGKL